jgi:hypothetical protein
MADEFDMSFFQNRALTMLLLAAVRTLPARTGLASESVPLQMGAFW